MNMNVDSLKQAGRYEPLSQQNLYPQHSGIKSGRDTLAPSLSRGREGLVNMHLSNFPTRRSGSAFAVSELTGLDSLMT